MRLIDKTLLNGLDKNPRNVAVRSMLDTFEEILERVRIAVEDLVAIPESDERMAAAMRIYCELKTTVNAGAAYVASRLKDNCDFKDPAPKIVQP
jgi:hypothetical protein